MMSYTSGCILLIVSIFSQTHGRSIFMQGVDRTRSGWNNEETILTPASITSGRFGVIGKVKADRVCSTQLLYFENANIGGAKNMIVCLTNPDRNGGNSTVFALDPDAFKVIWANNIGLSAIWMTQAPAIDPDTKTMFFTYKKGDTNPTQDEYGFNYLIGLDLTTGHHLPDSPLLVNATVPGTGLTSVNGQLSFQNTVPPPNRLRSNSRISMLILDGVLYFGFSHNPDTQPYHGWIFSYKYDFTAKKFVLLGAWCSTPNDSEGGIWQGGQGISSDGKFLYFNIGNGNYDPTKSSYGMSVIKMTLDLKVVDYFTPAQWKRYSAADEDVSGCGNMLVPNSPYLFTAVTKYGGAHLIDTRNMGKWANASNDTCRQSFILADHIIFPGGNPVGWSDGKQAKMYAWAPHLNLYQWVYNPSTELISLPLKSWTTEGSGGLFVSSNGGSDAILWGFDQRGHLYAFDASKDISAGPIWSDTTNLSPGASWTWPTVVNGRVYVPCGDGSVTALGLK